MKGRPKKDIKRDIILRVRLTQEEDQKLSMIAYLLNVTKSDFVRYSISKIIQTESHRLTNMPLNEEQNMKGD